MTRHSRTLLAALLMLPFPAAAQQTEVIEGQTTIVLPDTTTYLSGERQILRLECRRSAAISAHDTTWLATLYAPDFAGIVARGLRVDRRTLFVVFTRDNPEARFRIDELAVREHVPGMAATVTGRLQTLAADGSVAGESRYVHFYVKREGRWQVVTAAGSAVPPPPAR